MEYTPLAPSHSPPASYVPPPNGYAPPPAGYTPPPGTYTPYGYAPNAFNSAPPPSSFPVPDTEGNVQIPCRVCGTPIQYPIRIHNMHYTHHDCKGYQEYVRVHQRVRGSQNIPKDTIMNFLLS
jgi:hypothetical protein